MISLILIEFQKLSFLAEPYPWQNVDSAQRQIDSVQLQIDSVQLQINSVQLQIDSVQLQIDSAQLQIDSVQLQIASYIALHRASNPVVWVPALKYSHWHCLVYLGLG